MKTINSMDEYHKQYMAAQDPSGRYWEEVADQFNWSRKWSKVSSGNFTNCDIKWFEGGQTNISENCLDRHLETQPNKTALIFEPNNPTEAAKTYTYKELHLEVCKFANLLKNKNIQKGDVVCFYMSMVPELLIGLLACARIGAIHSVVFGGFSAKALSERIIDCDAKMLVTNDGGHRGSKIIPLKKVSDQALANCPSVESVMVVQRTNCRVDWNDTRDFWYHDEIQNMSADCPPVQLDSEDPLFILYTSGSTGKPKGLMHTTAGYMVWAAQTFKNVFQVGDQDIYWCTADIGWITGHSYITYGPLLNGATNVMFEGVPTYPDAGRFWEVVDKHQITHFYTAPTAIRALECCGLNFVKPHSLKSLKVLGTVGEPINEEAWHWYDKEIGKGNCPIVDTWWQTETGGIMISPLAGITPTIASFATQPLPGVEPLLVDNDGNEIKETKASGNLCIKTPWPGIARTIYGDHDRYKQTYFSSYKGLYFTGDGARRDENGNYRITGRVDDVVNVSGHRIGTAEVENAVNEHSSITESAVVGFPHDIKGQGIYAYVITNEECVTEKLYEEVNKLITEHIGPIAKLDYLQITPGLPKTRSGKIMRRILRKVASNELDSFGDISTLLNPEVVQSVINGRVNS